MCPKCAHGHILGTKVCPEGPFLLGTFGHILGAFLLKCAQNVPTFKNVPKMCPVAVDKITILHPVVAFWAHFGHKF